MRSRTPSSSSSRRTGASCTRTRVPSTLLRMFEGGVDGTRPRRLHGRTRLRGLLQQLLILIVEDDRDVARLLAEVLESEGYCTATAGNGCEALDQLRNNVHPD